MKLHGRPHTTLRLCESWVLQTATFNKKSSESTVLSPLTLFKNRIEL